MAISNLEQKFADLWVAMYPDIDLHSEYKFCDTRRYRIDFCHIPSRVGIEINGATWVKGGHSSGTGLQRDYEKQLLAASLGWVILPLTANDVENPAVLKLVKQTIDLRLRKAA